MLLVNENFTEFLLDNTQILCEEIEKVAKSQALKVSEDVTKHFLCV